MGERDQPRIVGVEQFIDKRGILTVLDTGIDFDIFPEIKRVFWITNIPPRETRANHAHKEQSQIIFAINGTVVVEVVEDAKYYLDDISEGLFVPPGWKIILKEFSEDCVILVICSGVYDEKDYVVDKEIP